MTDEPVYYHGTRRGFTRGGYVAPRAFHKGEGTSAPLVEGREPPADSDQYVYCTTHLGLAWAYAWAAAGRGRPKVLTIQPGGHVEPDPEHGEEMAAFRISGFCRVLAVDIEPVMDELEAAAGWQVLG